MAAVAAVIHLDSPENAANAKGHSFNRANSSGMDLDGEDPHVVLGAPGGTQIAMGVTSVVLNVLDHGMTMTEAVSAPRFSATSDAIDVTNRIPRYVTEELEAQGYEVIRSPFTYGIAAVHGIRIVDGKCDGGADPGHDGVALTV